MWLLHPTPPHTNKHTAAPCPALSSLLPAHVVDGAHTQLALDGRDKGGALEQGARQGLQALGHARAPALHLRVCMNRECMRT